MNSFGQVVLDKIPNIRPTTPTERVVSEIGHGTRSLRHLKQSVEQYDLEPFIKWLFFLLYRPQIFSDCCLVEPMVKPQLEVLPLVMFAIALPISPVPICTERRKPMMESVVRPQVRRQKMRSQNTILVWLHQNVTSRAPSVLPTIEPIEY